MTNMQASLGVAQLENLDLFVSRRVELVEKYNESLRHLSALTLPKTASNVFNIHWLYTVSLDENKAGFSRDTFVRELNDLGIDSRPVFPCLHAQPAYNTFFEG